MHALQIWKAYGFKYVDNMRVYVIVLMLCRSQFGWISLFRGVGVFALLESVAACCFYLGAALLPVELVIGWALVCPLVVLFLEWVMSTKSPISWIRRRITQPLIADSPSSSSLSTSSLTPSSTNSSASPISRSNSLCRTRDSGLREILLPQTPLPLVQVQPTAESTAANRFRTLYLCTFIVCLLLFISLGLSSVFANHSLCFRDGLYSSDDATLGVIFLCIGTISSAFSQIWRSRLLKSQSISPPLFITLSALCQFTITLIFCPILLRLQSAAATGHLSRSSAAPSPSVHSHSLASNLESFARCLRGVSDYANDTCTVCLLWSCTCFAIFVPSPFVPSRWFFV